MCTTKRGEMGAMAKSAVVTLFASWWPSSARRPYLILLGAADGKGGMVPRVIQRVKL